MYRRIIHAIAALLSAYLIGGTVSAVVRGMISRLEYAEDYTRWEADVLGALRDTGVDPGMWVLGSWLAVWLWCELVVYRRGAGGKRSLLLLHLRYAPLATCAFYLIWLPPSEQLMIEHSRWQITRYIYSDAPPEVSPTFDLYNDYKGWCGNGYAAHEYWLYGETAAARFESDDPRVRARAFQATRLVYDWVNLPPNGVFDEVLRRARVDPDPLVRRLAAEHCSKQYVNCPP
ncbi:MAG TPA: hypothetical protein VGB76_05100 [Pyrinomonadaceae bacterium]|jgi:hypothetical protein